MVFLPQNCMFFVENSKKICYNRNMEFGQKKNIKLIFIYLAFYGLSVGVWSDFAQIWLKQQGITIPNIGMIVAGATFTAGIIVIFMTKYIKKVNELFLLKNIFVFKLLFLSLMLVGNFLSIKWLCITAFILDSIVNNLIVSATYPIISYILKSERAYSTRKLVEYAGVDIGLLLASLLIGRQIGSLIIDYNTMLMLSLVFTLCSTICVLSIKNGKIFYTDRKNIIKNIFKDKILRVYFLYFFVSQMAYFTGLGMQLLTIVTYAGFSSSTAGLFIVIGCICGDFFGVLALKKLTPKNDYLTIIIKFGTRFLFYLAIVIYPIKEVLLISIFVSLFISRAYENKTDGIYINRCNKAEMFTFSNLRYIFGYMGKAIGTLIIGFTFELGLRYIFGICISLMVLQITFALCLVKMRKNEAKWLLC